MNFPRYARLSAAATLTLVLLAGISAAVWPTGLGHTRVVGYFDNSTGVFVGDDVRILGVNVGKIEKIEPQPQRAKITFWFDKDYKVPADAKAVVLSPSLVTARAIQLTPAYTGGPTLPNNAEIPQQRTAVPVEWDEVRSELRKLTQMLQPTRPGGVSSLGEVINTAADNLRGQGAEIRESVIRLSQAVSALGDHSSDLFSTIKNLATLVSALEGSQSLMRQLNQNLAGATALLADQPDEVANAVKDLNTAVGDVNGFVADNRDTLGTTSDKVASVSQALIESLDDVKQFLHIAPNTAQDFVNIYQPAQGTLSGALSTNNFSDPISFLCGAIQAASRLGAAQSAKLCVQYLAPIIKNRQYNFFPLGENLFVGASARPNEITYSEDWMRPDYVPPQPQTAPPPNPPPAAPAPPPAQATNPAAGLTGMMMPGGKP
jgi:phospholipid/cholesterol/gamma-HCH transport system substrate-binding protein